LTDGSPQEFQCLRVLSSSIIGKWEKSREWEKSLLC
jgi:hypothetical protein